MAKDAMPPKDSNTGIIGSSASYGLTGPAYDNILNTNKTVQDDIRIVPTDSSTTNFVGSTGTYGQSGPYGLSGPYDHSLGTGRTAQDDILQRRQQELPKDNSGFVGPSGPYY